MTDEHGTLEEVTLHGLPVKLQRRGSFSLSLDHLPSGEPCCELDHLMVIRGLESRARDSGVERVYIDELHTNLDPVEYAAVMRAEGYLLSPGRNGFIGMKYIR